MGLGIARSAECAGLRLGKQRRIRSTPRVREGHGVMGEHSEFVADGSADEVGGKYRACIAH